MRTSSREWLSAYTFDVPCAVSRLGRGNRRGLLLCSSPRDSRNCQHRLNELQATSYPDLGALPFASSQGGDPRVFFLVSAQATTMLAFTQYLEERLTPQAALCRFLCKMFGFDIWARNRPGLLETVTAIISGRGFNMRHLQGDSEGDAFARFTGHLAASEDQLPELRNLERDFCPVGSIRFEERFPVTFPGSEAADR